MTQDYLDTEIALAKKIFMYYTDKLYDYLAIGSDKYQVWYRDSLQLYFLLSFEEAVILYDGVPYIGYYEILNNNLRRVFDKVREYYRTECDVTGEYGTLVRTITVPTYVEPYISDWKEVTYLVTSDNTTEFTLPFTYANIDPESLMVSIEGFFGKVDNTIVGDGYHIVGNTFYWHHYFNLDNGNKVHFKYKQIKGV